MEKENGKLDLLFLIVGAMVIWYACEEQPQPDTYVYPSQMIVVDSAKTDTIKTD